MTERVKVFNDLFGSKRPKYEQVYLDRKQRKLELEKQRESVLKESKKKRREWPDPQTMSVPKSGAVSPSLLSSPPRK